MIIPDPIELGEMRAERFEDRIQGNIYTCSCGNKCSLHEVEALSPDPYAEPFCPNCILCYVEKCYLAKEMNDEMF